MTQLAGRIGERNYRTATAVPVHVDHVRTAPVVHGIATAVREQPGPT